MKSTPMAELPECDFCKQEGRDPPEPAEYDARTTLGVHAYMCQEHFDKYGTELGTRLVRPVKEPDERIKKADELCRRCGKSCLEDSWNKQVIRFRIMNSPFKVEAMLELGLYCEEV
uniref:Uncharacterized protein n=1 Tax=viral metagenome TaxID=1070528 RepID=A0A6M3M7Y9_9ZZZZ